MIATILGGVWGAYRIYDKWKNSDIKFHVSIQSVIEKQAEQHKTDSLLLLNQERIGKNVEYIKQSDSTNTIKLKSLESSYVKYISSDKSLGKNVKLFLIICKD